MAKCGVKAKQRDEFTVTHTPCYRPRMQFPIRVGLFLLLVVLGVLPLGARVLRIEITSRTDVLQGNAFGETGAYERIIGRVYFSVPVANKHNRQIVDLDNAVNLKDGEVEFSSDFVAVRPKDAKKGNGSMLLQVPNRGRASRMTWVEGGDSGLANDDGDAWLLRDGFTAMGRNRARHAAFYGARGKGRWQDDYGLAAR